jgi:hypothetical protein
VQFSQSTQFLQLVQLVQFLLPLLPPPVEVIVAMLRKVKWFVGSGNKVVRRKPVWTSLNADKVIFYGNPGGHL